MNESEPTFDDVTIDDFISIEVMQSNGSLRRYYHNHVADRSEDNIYTRDYCLVRDTSDNQWCSSDGLRVELIAIERD